MALQSINPATDQLVAEHPETTPDEVTRILRAARAASGSWRRTAPPERAASLRRAGALLRARKDELARMMAVEMGKPLAQGRAEAEKCAWVCDYYAEEGAGFLAPETIPTDASRSYAAFEPLGVVLAVMPWNFPLWQVFRFAAPALFFFSSRRRHTRWTGDWSSDVCSSDLYTFVQIEKCLNPPVIWERE